MRPYVNDEPNLREYPDSAVCADLALPSRYTAKRPKGRKVRAVRRAQRKKARAAAKRELARELDAI